MVRRNRQSAHPPFAWHIKLIPLLIDDETKTSMYFDNLPNYSLFYLFPLQTLISPTPL